jgi:EmrB/QacA subfamily drug resistance transporter
VRTMSGGLDRRLWAISSVVILGAIMSILDTTIVNVAIDALARDLHASLGTIQWVSTGYMLALATVIPLTGWAAERFGTKRLFIVAVTLFVAGSALCGAAWSSESLIAFRVLQGLGGGMVMPTGMMILAHAAGPQRMGRVMSVIGVPMLIAPVIGPVLGGYLIDEISWRWIFFVNIPVGAVALVLATKILDRDRPQERHPLDVRGFLYLSPGLTALVYGLAEAGSVGSMTAIRPLVSVAVGLVLIGLFIRHALRATRPLLDLQLFRVRAFWASSATTFVLGGALFGAMILIPLYYQLVHGASALEAGLLMAPQGLGVAVAMPIAGRLADRLGPGKIVVTGLGVVLLGTFAFTQVTDSSSYVVLGVSLFFRGAGLGMTMMPAMSAAYQVLDRAAVPRATTTLNILNRVGGALGTAILAVALQGQIEDNLAGLVPGGASSGLGSAQVLTPEQRAVVAPPLAEAFGTTFWYAMALTLVAVIPALLLPMGPPKPPATPPPDVAAEEREAVLAGFD